MEILIFPYNCPSEGITGYTNLKASERPDGWLPAGTPQILAHDIVEHIAGPTYEIQAIGSYEQVRGQWQGNDLSDDIAVALDYLVEDLQPYSHLHYHDDLFEHHVHNALEKAEEDYLKEWIDRYGTDLERLLISNLSKGWDDAIAKYGEHSQGYDHFHSVVEALTEPMETGGTFILNLQTYETNPY